MASNSNSTTSGSGSGSGSSAKVSKRGRSALRPPPQDTSRKLQPSSMLNCFMGEAQSTRVSALQTHLLGHNCVCPKGSCNGSVYVEEIDRALTAPCSDFPIYSLETHRFVKCTNCSYVSTLESHRLLSHRGCGRLPVVKLQRAADGMTTSSNSMQTGLAKQIKMVAPPKQRDAKCTTKTVYTDHLSEGLAKTIHLQKQRVQQRGQPQSTKPKARSKQLVLDTISESENSNSIIVHDKETPRCGNTSANKRNTVEADHLIERLRHRVAGTTIDDGDGTTKPQNHAQPQPYSPGIGESNGPLQWFLVKPDIQTDILGLARDQQRNKGRAKGTSPRHLRRRDPPNSDDESGDADAPSHIDDETGYRENEAPEIPRINFDRLYRKSSKNRRQANDGGDLIQYLTNHRAIAESKIPTDIQEKANNTSADDPPMKDPPFYYHSHSRNIREDPVGSRYRQPKGKKKGICPSLSSRLTNPNRHGHRSKHRGKDMRYPRSQGSEEEISEFRDNAPEEDSDDDSDEPIIMSPVSYKNSVYRDCADDGFSPITDDDTLFISPYQLKSMVPSSMREIQFASEHAKRHRSNRSSHYGNQERRSLRKYPDNTDTSSVNDGNNYYNNAPMMSLPAVGGAYDELARVDLPGISYADKALDDVIQESIAVLKESMKLKEKLQHDDSSPKMPTEFRRHRSRSRGMSRGPSRGRSTGRSHSRIPNRRSDRFESVDDSVQVIQFPMVF